MQPKRFPKVDHVRAFKFSIFGQDRVLVVASGVAPTSGWSNPRLSPYFYVTPPADGFWEFDFLADPPVGPVLDIEVPACAVLIYGAPAWAKGIRVHANNNSAETNTLANAKLKDGVPITHPITVLNKNVIVREQLAYFEDSIQPIGMCSFTSVRMKKLCHQLIVSVEGPDEGAIRRCLAQAAAAGLIAAIVAVYITGGAALGAAVSAFVQYLIGCLGASYSVRIDDQSHWEEWCT